MATALATGGMIPGMILTGASTRDLVIIHGTAGIPGGVLLWDLAGEAAGTAHGMIRSGDFRDMPADIFMIPGMAMATVRTGAGGTAGTAGTGIATPTTPGFMTDFTTADTTTMTITV